MEEEKSAKERVEEKFNLAADLKKSKTEKRIDSVEIIDGKIKANFSVSGKTGGSIESTYQNYPKIFDDFDDFAEYAKAFLTKN